MAAKKQIITDAVFASLKNKSNRKKVVTKRRHGQHWMKRL